MKQLLIISITAVVAMMTSAAELTSFFGVKFGESVYKDKFAAFDGALKNRGMSPSDIAPSIYAVLKDAYIYKLSKPFKSYNEVIVRANANGEVYYVGVLEFFKEGQLENKMKDSLENAKWILSTYGNDAVKITDATHPKLYGKLKENLTKGVGESATTAKVFFGFQGANGNFPSQIITSAVIFDCESGWGVVAMVAEDIALENAPARNTDDKPQTGMSNDSQLSRVQALLAKDRAKKQAEDASKQKGIDSFCGIPFGSTVNGKMQRTVDGKYLTCLVELETPFRGIETAIVYASVKTKRIFCVQLIEDTNDDFGIESAVSKRYGFEGEGGLLRYGGYRKMWRFTTGDTIEFQWQYINSGPNQRIMLKAINKRILDIADDEFEKESGGDGSAVL